MMTTYFVIDEDNQFLLDYANQEAVRQFGKHASVVVGSLCYWDKELINRPFQKFETLPSEIVKLNAQMGTTIAVYPLWIEPCLESLWHAQYCLVIVPQTDLDAVVWELSGL